MGSYRLVGVSKLACKSMPPVASRYNPTIACTGTVAAAVDTRGRPLSMLCELHPSTILLFIHIQPVQTQQELTRVYEGEGPLGIPPLAAPRQMPSFVCPRWLFAGEADISSASTAVAGVRPAIAANTASSVSAAMRQTTWTRWVWNIACSSALCGS